MSKTVSHLQIGVDTGGTFTDLVASDGRTVRTAKVPSTPPDFHLGVVAAIQSILQEGETADLVHGSTVATNALLERKGHPVAFITTEGFADLLLIGRQNRPVLYDLEPRRAVPIVRDEHVFTVAERIAAMGGFFTPLDPAEVERLTLRIKSMGLEHVAICLLFSFINPTHEQQLGSSASRSGIDRHALQRTAAGVSRVRTRQRYRGECGPSAECGTLPGTIA